MRLANEALAMTAVLAAAEALTIRIQIVPGGIGGWAGEGLVKLSVGIVAAAAAGKFVFHHMLQPIQCLIPLIGN